MKLSITQRLFLAILAAALLSVVSMMLIMHWSIDRGFHRFVNSLEQTRLARLSERLEQNFASQGSWDSLKNDPTRWRQLIAESLPYDQEESPGRHRGGGRNAPSPANKIEGPARPPPPGRGFTLRVFLLDPGKQPLISVAAIPDNAEVRPLQHGNQVVGYLGLLPPKRLSDEHQLRFLNEQKFAFALVAVMVVLLATGLSLLLAKFLVRPIRTLAAATDRLAAGEFTIRVPVASADELGQLARDFNMLALTLEKNEQTRRQWVADISHELRTPLAILRGEIEAIQDGIRQPTPENIRSLHGEVCRLGRLVDDLYQLSLSDLGALSYRMTTVNLGTLLNDALAAYRAEFATKNISLRSECPDSPSVVVSGDPERLRQLFANLLDNSLKYSHAGGRTVIRLSRQGAFAIIDIDDSPPGVEDKELHRLFDRLYRVESSRSRAGGGAGLGLAICRNIVEAHLGSIEAQPSPLGGIRIRLQLPLVVNT